MIEIKIVGFDIYLEQIRNIRTEVFSIEQGVPRELEFDGLDPVAVRDADDAVLRSDVVPKQRHHFQRSHCRIGNVEYWAAQETG